MSCGQMNLRMGQFIANINREYENTFGRHCNSRHRRHTKTNWLFNGMRNDIWRVMNKDVTNRDIDRYNWLEICESAQDAEWFIDLSCKRHEMMRQPSGLSHRIDDFLFDEDEYIHVYTDGACLGNGRDNPVGGIGVFFNHNHPQNLADPLYPWDYGRPITNNMAEIIAPTAAIITLKNNGFSRAVIFTDSELLVNMMTNWIFIWLRNGWKGANGGKVINKPELRQLLRACEGFDAKWVHVEGHSKVKGNLQAHNLAQNGAKKLLRSF